MTSSSKGKSTIFLPHIDLSSIFPNLHVKSQSPKDGETQNDSHQDPSSSLPPDYSSALELSVVTTTSSSSTACSDDGLPSYDDQDNDGGKGSGRAPVVVAGGSSSVVAGPTAPGFRPTKRFQIETAGHPLIALPLPPRPAPIPVYAVSPGGEVVDLKYTSLRDARSSSNSCVLVRAEDNLPVGITTYRFGPTRPPKILLLETSDSSPSSLQPVFTSTEVAQLLKTDPPPPSTAEPIEVSSDGCTTRSQTLRTPLGTFRWRYGTRTERREASPTTTSLLILEKITTVHLAGGRRREQEERRRRVAQFVRSDELRTEGSTRRTAGNGGRLEIDLGEWMRDHEKGAGGEAEEAEEAERLVVASCLVMLKKEVDRRRLHQAVVLMAGASGGP